MTTQAKPALHVVASIPSIPPCPAVALYDGDVSVPATFRPHDPIGATEVVASLDLPDDTALLNLLDTTIARLTAYRDAYRQAMDADPDPAPDRLPRRLPPSHGRRSRPRARPCPAPPACPLVRLVAPAEGWHPRQPSPSVDGV